MSPANVDRLFAGSIPQLYERFLAPLIFEPYAGVGAVDGKIQAHVVEIER